MITNTLMIGVTESFVHHLYNVQEVFASIMHAQVVVPLEWQSVLLLDLSLDQLHASSLFFVSALNAAAYVTTLTTLLREMLIIMISL